MGVKCRDWRLLRGSRWGENLIDGITGAGERGESVVFASEPAAAWGTPPPVALGIMEVEGAAAEFAESEVPVPPALFP